MIDYARIRELAAAGKGAAEIARALGCSKKTVLAARGREPLADPGAAPADPDYLSDAEVLRRLTACVRRLEAEDRAAHRKP